MADEKKKGIVAEFKEFIARGNVVDMAVGVIIGGAFTSIVNSLVNDIFTPFLGMILAGVNFESLGITIPWGNRPYINIGNFIQCIISFLLTAICVFAIVKVINAVRNNTLGKKKEEPKPEAPKPEPAPTKEELLLAEIRDLLKEQQNK
ncbi:MAG: large-conductance mechanosensitive channel protein MscL [Oscillospiraceae bacterium]